MNALVDDVPRIFSEESEDLGDGRLIGKTPDADAVLLCSARDELLLLRPWDDESRCNLRGRELREDGSDGVQGDLLWLHGWQRKGFQTAIQHL